MWDQFYIMVAKKSVSVRALFSFIMFSISIVLFFTERNLSIENREVGEDKYNYKETNKLLL